VARALGTALYSPNCPERLSEKGRRRPQRSPADHPMTLFALRIPPKSTLEALLVYLLGQSQKRILGNSLPFGYAHPREGYTLWISQLIAQSAL
jgi:hypothetical protein